MTAGGVGPAGDETDLVGGAVVALKRVAAARRRANSADVHDIRVVRADGNVPALAGAGHEAILPEDAGVVGAIGDGNAGIVLLRAVDVVRIASVGGEVV